MSNIDEVKPDTTVEAVPETKAAETPMAESEAEEKVTDSSLMGYLINGTMALVIVLVAMVAYHFAFVVPNKQRIAVVDIAEILQLKQLEVTLTTAKPEATDVQRGEAYDSISRFAKDVEVAINSLQSECGCILLVRAAVVKTGSGEDMTDALKQRLGMAHLNQNQLMQQLRNLGGRGTPPLLEGTGK